MAPRNVSQLMKGNLMNIHRFLPSILLGTVLWFGGYQPAFAQLDCNPAADGPDAIQVAIDAAAAAGDSSVDIFFTGTCNSFATRRMDVKVIGTGTGTATIDGFVDISEGNFAELEDFRVDGIGIDVTRGSYAEILRVHIEGSLNVTNNSGARLRNSTINGPVDDQAVIALFDSYVELRNNIITGNSPNIAAVTATRHSTLRAQNGNTVSGAVALSVVNGSYANIRDGAWTGDVRVFISSTLVTRPGAGYVGNIAVSEDSALINERNPGAGPVIVTGDVICADEESSMSGSFLVGGDVDCTGFDDDDFDQDDDDD